MRKIVNTTLSIALVVLLGILFVHAAETRLYYNTNYSISAGGSKSVIADNDTYYPELYAQVSPSEVMTGIAKTTFIGDIKIGSSYSKKVSQTFNIAGSYSRLDVGTVGGQSTWRITNEAKDENQTFGGWKGTLGYYAGDR